MAWFTEWVTVHETEISAVIVALTFVVTLINLIRAGKVNGSLTVNTTTTSKLTSALELLNGTKDSIDNSSNVSNTVINRVNSLEKQVIDNNRCLSAILDLNVMLCLRSKDEDVRNYANLISNSLKYKEAVTVEELRNEIANLKAELKEAKEEAKEAAKPVEVTKAEIKKVKKVKKVDEVIRG